MRIILTLSFPDDGDDDDFDGDDDYGDGDNDDDDGDQTQSLIPIWSTLWME